jgi:hypothetical protein
MLTAPSRTASSYNRIFFINCRIYGVGWGSSGGNRTGIFDFYACIFGWISEITGVAETSNQTIGLLLGSGESNNTTTGKISGCSIPVSNNGFQQVDSIFKSRVVSGYSNPGVYQ